MLKGEEICFACDVSAGAGWVDGTTLDLRNSTRPTLPVVLARATPLRAPSHVARVEVRLDIADCSDRVRGRRTVTPALIAIRPVVQDEPAGRVGDVVGKRVDVDAVDVKVDAVSKPVEAVFVVAG